MTFFVNQHTLRMENERERERERGVKKSRVTTNLLHTEMLFHCVGDTPKRLAFNPERICARHARPAGSSCDYVRLNYSTQQVLTPEGKKIHRLKFC